MYILTMLPSSFRITKVEWVKSMEVTLIPITLQGTLFCPNLVVKETTVNTRK